MFTEQIFYGIRCDRCGKDFESHGDYSYMVEKGDIQDEAYEQDWQHIDGMHFCPDCYEENPDPDHDDDHEFRPKPFLPPQITTLKRFLHVLGGWTQEIHEDQVLFSFYTHAYETDVAPEYIAMIDKILGNIEHKIEVVKKESSRNMKAIIYITLKRFYKGDRIKVISHNTYKDLFGKEGEILKEYEPRFVSGCYAVHIFDEESPEPHYINAYNMELLERKAGAR